MLFGRPDDLTCDSHSHGDLAPRAWFDCGPPRQVPVCSEAPISSRQGGLMRKPSGVADRPRSDQYRTDFVPRAVQHSDYPT